MNYWTAASQSRPGAARWEARSYVSMPSETAHRVLRAMRTGCACGLLPLALSACTSYQPQPLSERSDLAGKISALQVDSVRLGIPGLKAEPFNAADGLDATEIAALAVLNNPGLKAERLQRGVRRAQLVAAGLLPNPELDVGVDHPISGPDSLNGYGLGITLPLRPLVTRGVATRGARARARKVDLQVVWREWQVAEKAKQLFAEARSEQRLRTIYQTERTLYAGRYRRDREALSRGDITLGVSAGDLVSLVDARGRLRELEQRENGTRHELRALLGLKPDTELTLTGDAGASMPTKKEIDTALVALAQRRPDLLALRAGYKSQEAAVRQAVLEQFPSVGVGITRGRDTGGVQTVGFGITISLPLFNRNQGRIAVERTTRKQLRQAYQTRLDAAAGEVDQVRRQAELLAHQLTAVRARLPELRRVANRAEQSMRSGDLDAGTYISLRGQLLAKRAEAVKLETTLAQAHVGLETLLGRPFRQGSPGRR